MVVKWETEKEDTRLIKLLAIQFGLAVEIVNELLNLVIYETFEHEDDIIFYDKHCNSIWFLLSGRALSYTNSGNDIHLTNLHIEGGTVFMGDMDSFIFGGLTEEGCRSHGVSSMLRLDKSHYDYIIDKHAGLERFILFITRMNLRKVTHQRNCLRGLKRDQKIELFFKLYPVFSLFLNNKSIRSLIKAHDDNIGTYRTDNNLRKDLIMPDKKYYYN
jgi:hypothetical protein